VLDNLYLAVRGVERFRFSLRLPRASDVDRLLSQELAEKVGLSGPHRPDGQRTFPWRAARTRDRYGAGRPPRLLLLDEPAAGLSPLERPALVSMLRTLPKDVTVVLIEHDMDVALQVADRVTVMHEGAVVFEGSPQETAASPLVQSIYLGNMGH
jgi:branched-chain amino acid transport system ATP-binding protein